MSANEDSATPSLTARGAATRFRIVTAAADLIYAHGVERTSLEDVMAASGVSKSQLYHYFEDKDALVLEVIALQTARVLSAQQPHLGALDSLRALKLWRDALVQLNTSTGTRGCPLGSLASELVNDSSSARKRVAAGFEIWNDSIERGLANMRERGELAPSGNPAELAVALLSAVQGGLLLSKATRSNRPLEISLDMAIDHIARHIKSKPGRAVHKKRG